MKQTKELKTGILVVVTIAVFVYGFNFLKGKDIFSNREIYYAVYPQVSGIVESNPVQVNGFKVGRVKKIELDGKSGKLIVTLAISDKNVKVTKGTVARIISTDLLSGKAIDLEMPQGNNYANDGDTLASDIDPSLQESVNATIKPLKDKAEKLIASVDSITTTFQAIFNKDTKDNLSKSFGNIKHALETFDRSSMRLDTMIVSEKEKVSIIFSKVESIATTLTNNNDKISNAIKNFSSISDSLTKANLARTIENANTALSNVSSVMEKINSGKGTAGLLVNDDKLYKNLTASSASLDSLLKDMEINPWRYISLRGKKHRTQKQK